MIPTDRDAQLCQRKAHGGFICQHRRDEHTEKSVGACVHMRMDHGGSCGQLCSCPGFVEAHEHQRYEPHHSRPMMPREGDKCYQGCCTYRNRHWETPREQAARAVTEPILQTLQPVRAKVQIPSDPFAIQKGGKK